MNDTQKKIATFGGVAIIFVVLGAQFGLLSVSQTTTLSFEAWDIDKAESGIGELTVYVNGIEVANVPSETDTSQSDQWVSFSYDVTTQATEGSNTLLFDNALEIQNTHTCIVRNIMVVYGGDTVLNDPEEHKISGNDPEGWWGPDLQYETTFTITAEPAPPTEPEPTEGGWWTFLLQNRVYLLTGGIAAMTMFGVVATRNRRR